MQYDTDSEDESNVPKDQVADAEKDCLNEDSLNTKMSTADLWSVHSMAEPPVRDAILEHIKPILEKNDGIPLGSFTTHPDGVVYLNTGDAAPTYRKQYSMS
jgi:hypothetical protein